MRIIHILKGKANPNTMNGVNKVVHHLATEQLLLGNHVEVWGITETPDRVRHPHDYPLRLFPATWSRFFLSRSLQSALYKLPKDAIVHLHSVFLPEFYSISRILRIQSISWVLSPHSGYARQSRRKNRLAKSLYTNLFEKHLIRHAKRIHAIGETEVADIHRLAPEQSVVLIPNGQDLEEVKFTPVKAIEPARPLFGYCGRIAKEHKGLDLLLYGFAEYKGEKGPGDLWLIGDGPDTSYLQRITENIGIAESVKFMGSMYGDKKLSHIAQMDVFVHTSRWEGMPMSVLEAAALGKPLLVSKETNMVNYIRRYKSGIVIDDNTSNNIFKAMYEASNLYRDNMLDMIGDNSMKMINEELNWKTISEKTIHYLYP